MPPPSTPITSEPFASAPKENYSSPPVTIKLSRSGQHSHGVASPACNFNLSLALVLCWFTCTLPIQSLILFIFFADDIRSSEKRVSAVAISDDGTYVCFADKFGLVWIVDLDPPLRDKKPAPLLSHYCSIITSLVCHVTCFFFLNLLNFLLIVPMPLSYAGIFPSWSLHFKC